MSKKYVIEIPDDTRRIWIDVFSEGCCYTFAKEVNDLKELNSDYINEHFSDLQDTAYQRGLEDAWEAAWLIFNMSDEDAMEAGLDTAFNLSASEAIEKLKAYEVQKADDEIKVGDEVRCNNMSGIVTRIIEDRQKVYVLWFDGSCGVTEKSVLTKTSRHFDILKSKILEEMM